MKGRYVSFVVTKGQFLRAGLMVFLLVVVATAPLWVKAGARLLTGVEPGVTLAGVPVGGKLEREVKELVGELAMAAMFLPKDAAIEPTTGEVIPDTSGRYVDVMATVGKVMTAPAGAKIYLVALEVADTLSKEALQPIYQGPTDSKQMAFTVNVDWGQEVLPGMLELFADRNVKVTFFLTGRWAEKFPEDAAKLAAAGHEIANHGLKHDHPKQLSDWDLTRLIVENEKVLRSITGEAAKLFAPPYGEVDARITKIAAQNGYRTIMWTIDTIDWQDPSPETIVQRVVGRAQPGAIVLMHPKPNTLKALTTIIDQLQSQGYKLVTVTELLQE